jgi:hypothetical protein
MSEIATLCPRCERPTTREELNRGRGTCRFCASALRAAKGMASKRQPEPEPEQGGHVAHTYGETHHDSESHVCEIEDFDLGAVEEALGEWHDTPADIRAEAAVLLGRLFVHVWAMGDRQDKLTAALVRFSAFFMAVRPDMLPETCREVAGQVGVSKQMVSYAITRAEQAFNFKSSRTRPLAGRENMRAARLKQIASGHPHPRLVAAQRKALAEQGKGLAMAGQGTPDPA